MLIKDVTDIAPVCAADRSELREILHPERDAVEHRYSLAHAVVKPKEASLPHRLTSTEVYYVIYGNGVMHIDDEARPIHSGHTVYVPPGAVQWIENTGTIDLAFLCIVDPAWRDDEEEVVS